MQNIILQKTAKLILIIMTAASLWLLIRGHNNPGGGFIAGIVAATGLILYAIVFGSQKVEKLLKYNTRNWIGSGLAIILVSIIIPIALGEPPMTAMWTTISLPFSISLHTGTPHIFETGVYISVIGIILSIIITIMEVLKWNS
ncbi:MnhB domain-containing protein [Marinilabiliaceae bacterium ANBcel2]|nr:MnhB domain-containing protein [Marinilabiliaceae bacterium ANBcel2]